MRWGDLINVDSLLVPYYSDYVASVGGLASNVLNEGWYLGELYGLMFLLLVMFIYFLIFWAINNHATSFVMYFSSVYMISNVFTFYRQSFVGAEIYILVVFVVTSLWIKSSLYRVIDARLPASHQTNHTIDKKWHDSLQQGEQHERKQTQ